MSGTLRAQLRKKRGSNLPALILAAYKLSSASMRLALAL